MNSFIFVRHGQSQANLDNVIAMPDSQLTAAGIEQAKLTAASVKPLGITAIVSSPLIRARQTAEVIAAALEIPPTNIHFLDDLRERDLGELKGKTKDRPSEYFYNVDNQYGVETRSETLHRMTRCLSQLQKLSLQGKLLVVGHAVSGFYLMEAARHKTVLDELDSPHLLQNAEYLAVDFAM